MRPDWQPALTISYRGRSLLFSAPGSAELKLGVKQSSSERKDINQLRSKQEKRRTTPSSLATGARVGIHDIREE